MISFVRKKFSFSKLIRQECKLQFYKKTAIENFLSIFLFFQVSIRCGSTNFAAIKFLLIINKLQNYITGKWISGDGDGQLLYNAVTGDPIKSASTKGLDFESILNYARNTGNPALRKLSFHDRGSMLKALALHLREHLPEFYTISYQTGATKVDSWIDIEGGIGNLFANASLRRKLPDESFCLDGEAHNLSKENTFMATHLLVPKEGVAIHINAFNFPVWGNAGKNCSELISRDALCG